MNDPLEKAGAKAPLIVGSGCTQRYDPDRLGPESGTDFPEAEALWERQMNASETTVDDGLADGSDDVAGVSSSPSAG